MSGKISRSDGSPRRGSLEARIRTPQGEWPRVRGILETTPPLRHQLAGLLRPLTREGRRLRPGYFLALEPQRIALAPRSARVGEKMKRHAVRAAIALLWPIGRAWNACQLWRAGLDRKAALAWWREIDAHRGDRRSDAPSTPSGAPFAAPAAPTLEAGMHA